MFPSGQKIDFLSDCTKASKYWIINRQKVSQMGHSQPLLCLFLSFQYRFFNIVKSKFKCWWLDSNHGSLASEVIALANALQRLPGQNVLTNDFSTEKWSVRTVGIFGRNIKLVLAAPACFCIYQWSLSGLYDNNITEPCEDYQAAG